MEGLLSQQKLCHKENCTTNLGENTKLYIKAKTLNYILRNASFHLVSKNNLFKNVNQSFQIASHPSVVIFRRYIAT